MSQSDQNCCGFICGMRIFSAFSFSTHNLLSYFPFCGALNWCFTVNYSQSLRSFWYRCLCVCLYCTFITLNSVTVNFSRFSNTLALSTVRYFILECWIILYHLFIYDLHSWWLLGGPCSVTALTLKTGYLFLEQSHFRAAQFKALKTSQSLSENLCALAGDAHEVTDSFGRASLKGLCAEQGMVLNIPWH